MLASEPSSLPTREDWRRNITRGSFWWHFTTINTSTVTALVSTQILIHSCPSFDDVILQKESGMEMGSLVTHGSQLRLLPQGKNKFRKD